MKRLHLLRTALVGALLVLSVPAFAEPGTGRELELKKASVAHYPPILVMEDYITKEAPKFGIDPKIAVLVARSEGLNKKGEHMGYTSRDFMRTAYGPFQLRMDGYGNDFDFGRAPTNLNWKKQVDYALELASKHGWGGWYGAATVGISDYCGIKQVGKLGGVQLINGGKCEVMPTQVVKAAPHKVLRTHIHHVHELKTFTVK